MKLDEVSATLCPIRIFRRDVLSTNSEYSYSLQMGTNLVYQAATVVFWKNVPKLKFSLLLNSPFFLRQLTQSTAEMFFE